MAQEVETRDKTLRYLLLDLAAAAAGMMDYRQHMRLCGIDRTDFCTCGLKEASDRLREVGAKAIAEAKRG